MQHADAYQAIQETVMALYKKLGGHYQTCYLYGSLAQGFYQPGESDINLLFVVNDDTSIHAVREAFLPILEKHGRTLGRVPGIATESAFLRYTLLYPAFGRHIAKHGKQVKGSQRVLRPTTPLGHKDHLARIAGRSIQASLALAPDLIEDESAKQAASRSLRSLIRQIRQGPVGIHETAASLFAELQRLLQRKMQELSLVPKAGVPVSSTTFLSDSPIQAPDQPYNVPNLKAVYTKLNHVILAVDTAEGLENYDWSSLSTQLKPEFGGLQVTTPTQMRLAVKYEFPLEYVLRNYRHKWGFQPLEHLNPSSWRVLRDASRFVSQIQIFDLPQAYLGLPASNQEEKMFHKIIHDFQNKLLNVRLQNELLARLDFADKSHPPEPLPERTAPSPVRISGIFEHLNWWGDYYFRLMQTAN